MISEEAIIGANVQIGHNVVIYAGVIVGDNVRIDDNAVIGKRPMKAANSATTSDAQEQQTTISDGCIIGTAAIIYQGASIGKHCLIADSASIRENVTIGDATIVGRNATIENDVRIGSNCKIQSNVQIVPYSHIEDYVFCSPGVMTSNDNYVGRTEKRKQQYEGITLRKGSRLGVGVITLPGVEIGRDALVGAGSVVTKDIPEGQLWVGTPARYVRKVPEEQLLEKQEFYNQ